MKNNIPIKMVWNEYKAYSLNKPIQEENKSYLESSLIRVLCWYRKRLLLWMVFSIMIGLFLVQLYIRFRYGFWLK